MDNNKLEVGNNLKKNIEEVEKNNRKINSFREMINKTQGDRIFIQSGNISFHVNKGILKCALLMFEADNNISLAQLKEDFDNL
jgi:hypothetical protein